MIGPDQSNHQTAWICLVPFVRVVRHAFIPKYSPAEERRERHVLFQLKTSNRRPENSDSLMHFVARTDHIIHIGFVVGICCKLRKASRIANVLLKFVPRQVRKSSLFDQSQIFRVYIESNERYVQFATSLKYGKISLVGPAPTLVPLYSRLHLLSGYFFSNVRIQGWLELHLDHLQAHRHFATPKVFLPLFVNGLNKICL
mmetsp:Transcript_39786/g.83643  ORF Transcript_39786/g.83643 Transcript_39786/m.83643 type:complete len:200 (+) Transcript_39786:456-1055(+)